MGAGDRSLVPALLLALSVPVATVTMAAECRHISWRTIAWILPARVPGVVFGAWLLPRFGEASWGSRSR